MATHRIYQTSNYTRDGDNATIIAKAFYNSELREYVVKLYIDGTHYEPADYFTNDKDDAIATANDMAFKASLGPSPV